MDKSQHSDNIHVEEPGQIFYLSQSERGEMGVFRRGGCKKESWEKSIFFPPPISPFM